MGDRFFVHSQRDPRCNDPRRWTCVTCHRQVCYCNGAADCVDGRTRWCDFCWFEERKIRDLVEYELEETLWLEATP